MDTAPYRVLRRSFMSHQPQRREATPGTPHLPAIQPYDSLAADYHELRYAGEANEWNEGMRRIGAQRLLPRSAGYALDVACGTGRGLMLLDGYASAVYGIDGTLPMLEEAKQNVRKRGLQARLAQANAARLPFPDASFDLVTCFNFIHLFPSLSDRRAFITEMARVLKPGGTVVVEFDNALQGLVLGGFRKYFGLDIGYDWPWQMRAAFPRELLTIAGTRGVNLPAIWRFPGIRRLEALTGVFPFGYLAGRLFIRAIRR
jgi:SAM-dependent methyltransferase